MFWLSLLEVIRLGLLLGVFGFAAWRDHKTGEVPNWLWLYIPFGAALTLAQLYFFTPYLLLFSLPLMLVMSLLSVGLFYISGVFQKMFRDVGDVFGGADGKALLALSLCYPLTPSFSLLPYVNYVLLAFGVAVLLVVVKKGLRRHVAVRFLPYLLVGVIAAAI